MDKPKKQSPQAKKSTCHKLKKTAFKSTTDIINYSADFSSINWLYIANFLCPHDHFLLFPWFIAKTRYIDDKSSIFLLIFSKHWLVDFPITYFASGVANTQYFDDKSLFYLTFLSLNMPFTILTMENMSTK